MDKLPDLTLVDPTGAPVRLTALPRPLVVYFYPKDDTSGCTREAQDFTALAGDFAAAGVTLLGISKDSPKRHSNFIAKYDLKVPLASDEDGAACEAFGVWVEKSLYGRKYMGIERATFLFGKDGELVRAWRKVKVPGHAEAVLAAAREG
ncbi:MAG: peroxiredoxin [Sphingomonadales bacterium]|nr:peroxiredoxin [Sphingomonadales bacterium]